MSKRQRQRLTSEQVELLREAAIQIRDTEKIVSPAQIARRLTQQHGIRVSRQRVHEWLQHDALTPAEVLEYRADRQKMLAAKLYQAAEKYIDQAIAVADKTRGKDAATAAAIFIDKALLISGEATDRTEVRGQVTTRHEEHYTIEYRIERYADVYAKLAARRSQVKSHHASNNLREPMDPARSDAETS